MKIIIGCSWAVGEYDKMCHLSGPGFGQLLMLHDQVLNLAVGAGSNSTALDRLEQFLNRYQTSIDDDVYWVVTSPSRCRDLSWFLTVDSLRNAMQKLLDSSLLRAVDLMQRHRLRIHLIGGLCDLNTIDHGVYAPLDFCVPSWGQLLTPNYYTTIFMCENWYDLGAQIQQQRPDLLLEWIEMSDDILLKQKTWEAMSTTFFKTDGWHPDAAAHRTLRDYIWPQWAHKL